LEIDRFFVGLHHFIACSLLVVPANSAASEIIFSQTERILGAHPQQLSPDSLGCIMFLRNF